jgi:spore maturation protein CgeB
VFFEKNQEWYESNRDLPNPEFCEVRLFDNWIDALPAVRRELETCDVALIGSYFPDGIPASQEVLESNAPVKAFYDIDTPITVANLRAGGTDYLQPQQVSGFDLYFSFTGGPVLRQLESEFGAPRAVPLYCSFDPEQYFPRGAFRVTSAISAIWEPMLQTGS